MFMPNLVKGGRGKKAPYETTHYRIPEPIKPVVEAIADRYRFLVITEDASAGERMLDRVQEVVTPKGGTKLLSNTDRRKAISLLEEALTLKANAGGAIKEKIRAALYYLV
jgi:hypothetical protein